MPWALYLWLVVVTGVRRGELCGLQLRDVDLDRGLVHVAFNYVVRAGQRIRKDTKTHQDRWLAIDPVTCALIASYLAEIKAELAAVGVELRDDAYLFSNDPAHARPWNPDWVTHRSRTLQPRPGWRGHRRHQHLQQHRHRAGGHQRDADRWLSEHLLRDVHRRERHHHQCEHRADQLILLCARSPTPREILGAVLSCGL
jgi:integrase